MIGSSFVMMYLRIWWRFCSCSTLLVYTFCDNDWLTLLGLAETYKSISSNHSLSSTIIYSLSAKGLLDKTSDLLCLSAGIWVNVKSKVNIPWIHLFIAALDCRFGSSSIPLMYLASISTISFLVPIMWNLQCHNALYKL